MPQQDRFRDRQLKIEFEPLERMTDLPHQERVSLVLVTNGRAALQLNNQSLMINAPCMLCLSPEDRVSLVESTKLAAQAFHFSPGFMNSSLTLDNLKTMPAAEIEDQHDRNMLMLFLTRDDCYKGLFDLPPQIYLKLKEWMAIIGSETVAQTDGFWTCRIRRYLLQTLYLLDDILTEQRKTGTGPSTKSTVDLALEYIHTHYQQPITLEILCGLVGTNRTTLCQRFKDQIGQTPKEYLLQYRMKIACEALAYTDLTLNEIAESTGFGYDTYFIRLFTSRLGMSPTDYRKQRISNRNALTLKMGNPAYKR